MKRWIGLSQRRGASLSSRLTPAEIPWRGSRRFSDATMTNVIIGGETMWPPSPGSAVAKFNDSCAESNINYTRHSCMRFAQSSLGRSSRSHVSWTVCAHYLENAQPSEPHQLCFRTPSFTLQPLSRRTSTLLLSFRTAASLPLLPAFPSPSVRRPASSSFTHKLWGMSPDISVAHPACWGTERTFGDKWTRAPMITHVLEQGGTSQDFPNQ